MARSIFRQRVRTPLESTAVMTDKRASAPRLPYTPPRLTTFGSLTQMTQLVGNMGLRDGGPKSDMRTG